MSPEQAFRNHATRSSAVPPGGSWSDLEVLCWGPAAFDPPPAVLAGGSRCAATDRQCCVPAASKPIPLYLLRLDGCIMWCASPCTRSNECDGRPKSAGEMSLSVILPPSHVQTWVGAWLQRPRHSVRCASLCSCSELCHGQPVNRDETAARQQRGIT